MAKNYTAYEAAVIINQGMNKENCAEYEDIARRFPYFTYLASGLNGFGIELLAALPSNVTARKINMKYREFLGVVEGGVSDDLDEVEADDTEEEEVAPKKNKKEKKVKRERKSKKAKEVEDDVLDEIEADEDEDDEPAPKKLKKAKKSKKVEEVEEDEDDDDDFDFE